LTHGETALLVKPGEADAFTAAVVTLFRDPDLAAALGLARRQAVEDRFNTEAQARRLADILRDRSLRLVATGARALFNH
jgi:glycosyltransferase involved in cell wall biosynthesis